MAARVDRERVLKEFGGVSLGDARLDVRLERIVSQLAFSPSDSFPEQMESEAEQEALYRFLSNPKVSMDAVLAGHRQQTLERIGGAPLVRVLHDTSEFAFAGEREGLGILRKGRKGFLAHFALAVGADEAREPFGVLGVHPFVNKEVLENRQLSVAEKSAKYKGTARADKKSSRWEQLAIDVGALLPHGVEAIHVMDQEADDYSVFSALVAAKQRFVIRGDAQRYTASGARIIAVLENAPAQAFRLVPITARSAKQATRTHPARAERLANLSVRWSSVTLSRPESAAKDTAPELNLWVVHVFEASPPRDEAPIDWTLISSDPIATLNDAIAVVDHYRARWLIEEYFKALKTGCAVEERQLCSLDGLLRALALFVPMAWALLTLRHLGRGQSPRAASFVFTANQLRLLRVLLEKRKRAFARTPSIRDAMLGIAALGGHIKNNGDPGWLVLARGFRRFVEAEEVWEAMRGCDQS